MIRTLNIYIMKNGQPFREEFQEKGITKERMKADGVMPQFKHGDPFKEDGIVCWYTYSLEDHERDEIAAKKQTPRP